MGRAGSQPKCHQPRNRAKKSDHAGDANESGAVALPHLPGHDGSWRIHGRASFSAGFPMRETKMSSREASPTSHEVAPAAFNCATTSSGRPRTMQLQPPGPFVQVPTTDEFSGGRLEASGKTTRILQ